MIDIHMAKYRPYVSIRQSETNHGSKGRRRVDRLLQQEILNNTGIVQAPAG